MLHLVGHGVVGHFDAGAFLAETGRMAQVAAVSRRNVPLLASLWFLHEAGRLWFSSAVDSPFPLAATRVEQIAVIVDDFKPPDSIRQIRIRGAAQREDHDVAIIEKIYARYLGLDTDSWPEFFQSRLHDKQWVLWSVWPDTGLAVSTPNFRGEEHRWSSRSEVASLIVV